MKVEHMKKLNNIKILEMELEAKIAREKEDESDEEIPQYEYVDPLADMTEEEDEEGEEGAK